MRKLRFATCKNVPFLPTTREMFAQKKNLRTNGGSKPPPYGNKKVTAQNIRSLFQFFQSLDSSYLVKRNEQTKPIARRTAEIMTTGTGIPSTAHCV